MGPILAANSIYRNIYSFFTGFLPDSLNWLAYFIAGLALALLVVNGLLLLAMAFTWMERRVLGRFQMRLGPNRAGPFGLLQPVADAIKLLFKEDIVPAVADRLVFNLAPLVMFVPGLLVLVVIPFGRNSFLADINIGLLFIIAVTSVSTLGIFMAGWSSGNRYAMFGAIRAVGQLISYEVPMVLSIVGILLLVGSLSLVDVVEGQRIPFIILQPLGFLIFFLAASAELNRTPFDLMEAESEIIAGFHIEYSGMKFGITQLAEFAAVVTSAAILSTLFLKGWEGPVLPSHVWFLIKVFFFLFLMTWIRATLPRFRVDQVMGFAWKVLFPLALVNIFVTAAEVFVWKEPSMGQLWVMAGINWGVGIGVILLLWSFMGQKMRRPAASVVSGGVSVEVR